MNRLGDDLLEIDFPLQCIILGTLPILFSSKLNAKKAAHHHFHEGKQHLFSLSRHTAGAVSKESCLKKQDSLRPPRRKNISDATVAHSMGGTHGIAIDWSTNPELFVKGAMIDPLDSLDKQKDSVDMDSSEKRPGQKFTRSKKDDMDSSEKQFSRQSTSSKKNDMDGSEKQFSRKSKSNKKDDLVSSGKRSRRKSMSSKKDDMDSSEKRSSRRSTTSSKKQGMDSSEKQSSRKSTTSSKKDDMDTSFEKRSRRRMTMIGEGGGVFNSNGLSSHKRHNKESDGPLDGSAQSGGKSRRNTVSLGALGSLIANLKK
jgi:hypothetical protein